MSQKFQEQECLTLVPPKVDSKTRTWVQVDYLGGDPRTHSERVRNVKKASQEREENNQVWGNEQVRAADTWTRFPRDPLRNHIRRVSGYVPRGWGGCAFYPLSSVPRWVWAVQSPGPTTSQGAGKNRDIGGTADARAEMTLCMVAENEFRWAAVG